MAKGCKSQEQDKEDGERHPLGRIPHQTLPRQVVESARAEPGVSATSQKRAAAPPLDRTNFPD